MITLPLPGAIAVMCLILPCSLASAAEVAMTRVLFCENDNAKMEVYVPQANISGLGCKRRSSEAGDRLLRA